MEFAEPVNTPLKLSHNKIASQMSVIAALSDFSL